MCRSAGREPSWTSGLTVSSVDSGVRALDLAADEEASNTLASAELVGVLVSRPDGRVLCICGNGDEDAELANTKQSEDFPRLFQRV